MATEPNNAEEQLKQYAAERRQQVPQEIHPATRSLLQGEALRTYGSPEQHRRARLRLRWMQALAWLVIAAAIPLFLLPRNPNDNAPAAAPTKPGEVTLPTEKKRGEAPIVLSDTKEPVAPVVLAPPAPSGAQPAPAPLKTLAESREQPKQEVTTRSARFERDQTVETLAARAASASPTKAAAKDAPASARLLFANSISNQEVLNEFRLEQTGERLKITDTKDASEYSGRVFSQAGGVASFQAAGFNRTLNQAAILTGQVVRATQAGLAPQQPRQSTATQLDSLQNNASNAGQFGSADNVRLQGQATIGNNQYKVDAQAMPAP